MIKNEIQKIIKENLPETAKISEIKIEKPGNDIYGDYSSNIALQLAGILKKTPQEIAENIKKEIEKDKKFVGFFEKITVQNNFLNFFISKKIIYKELEKIINKKFCVFPKQKKKINLEFISANPTGKLHIGNGRGAFWGDVMGNIFKKLGYKVEKEFFINDSKNSNQIKEIGKTAMGEGASYLNDYLKGKIKEISKKIAAISKKSKNKENVFGSPRFAGEAGEVGHLLGSEVQKDNEKFIKNKLKIKFDNWVSEQAILEKNKKQADKIFKDLEKRKLVYEKDGAVWLKTSEFGEKKDWVVIRQDKLPAYLFSDLIYHLDKIKRKFNFIIDVWGADHQAHVNKMTAVMKILKYKGDFKVFITQMVKLRGGEKLSKRKGNIIELEELVDLVGLDVARYFYLTKSLDTQMEFDLDLAREQSQKNPVFYIQYAYARINSILKSAKEKIKSPKFDLLVENEEMKLIKQLLRFPEILEEVGNDYQINKLISYTYDLASLFHKFYQECRVLGEDKNLTDARLALISGTKNILAESLDLLGISKPEKM